MTFKMGFGDHPLGVWCESTSREQESLVLVLRPGHRRSITAI